MLGRNKILGFVAHIRCREGLRGIAARLGGLPDLERIGALRVRIGDEFFRLVFDAHQRGRKARDLPLFGQNERDRLSAELDRVVIEWTERRAFIGRDIVLIGTAGAGHARTVLVREHIEHAVDKGFAGVDTNDAALRNGRHDDIAIGEVRNVELAGIFRRSGHLGVAIDARGRCSDVSRHDAHRIFLLDCDCGVAAAACAKVRMMARRARSILNALCA
jgi:hypothetical protein